nr:hypothetical protein [candidate division Zixibacteria bacterium]
MILSKSELARQIHYVLKETYPGLEFDPEIIIGLITESGTGEGEELQFGAGELARIMNMDLGKVIEQVYRGLGIDFEKNWHDKVLFKMTLKNDMLIFKPITEHG